MIPRVGFGGGMVDPPRWSNAVVFTVLHWMQGRLVKRKLSVRRLQETVPDRQMRHWTWFTHPLFDGLLLVYTHYSYNCLLLLCWYITVWRYYVLIRPPKGSPYILLLSHLFLFFHLTSNVWSLRSGGPLLIVFRTLCCKRTLKNSLRHWLIPV